MDLEIIIKSAIEYGVSLVCFIVLLIYVLKTTREREFEMRKEKKELMQESIEREEKLYSIIDNFTKKYEDLKDEMTKGFNNVRDEIAHIKNS